MSEMEIRTIKIKTNVNTTCPYCGKEVNLNRVSDLGYVISGHGRFKSKTYFHKHCIDRAITGFNG